MNHQDPQQQHIRPSHGLQAPVGIDATAPFRNFLGFSILMVRRTCRVERPPHYLTRVLCVHNAP